MVLTHSMRCSMWSIACRGFGCTTLLNSPQICMRQLLATSPARSFTEIVGNCTSLFLLGYQDDVADIK
eukprot:10773745-Prorocentrum_lima.AAC.1